jgi:hypothetical protein
MASLLDTKEWDKDNSGDERRRDKSNTELRALEQRREQRL